MESIPTWLYWAVPSATGLAWLGFVYWYAQSSIQVYIEAYETNKKNEETDHHFKVDCGIFSWGDTKHWEEPATCEGLVCKAYAGAIFLPILMVVIAPIVIAYMAIVFPLTWLHNWVFKSAERKAKLNIQKNARQDPAGPYATKPL